jgi:hypothetical protein
VRHCITEALSRADEFIGSKRPSDQERERPKRVEQLLAGQKSFFATSPEKKDNHAFSEEFASEQGEH